MKTKENKFSGTWGTFVSFLIILLLIPSIASSEEIYKFERMWPTLQQPWYFDRPTAIAVDPSGNVYVADSGNDRIQKFTSNGQLITMWGGEGSGDGEFDSPEEIAFDSMGNVYVADAYNFRIQKFTSDGRFISTFFDFDSQEWPFPSPRGLAIDVSGNVYVADRYDGMIYKISSDGELLTTWGGRGSGQGQLNYPQDIAVDGSGYLYVVDSFNHRVQKFSSEGHFIKAWGSEGSGDGEFDMPDSIAIDGTGIVYVTDCNNHRIQMFTTDGHFVAQWGYAGEEVEILGFETIAVDPLNNVYVATSVDYIQIQKFTSDGQFIDKWNSYGSDDGQFQGAEGLGLDALGHVYVADQRNDRIQKFTSDGQFVGKFGEWGFKDHHISNPGDIAIDASGNIYVTSTFHGIQKFNSDGQFIEIWADHVLEDDVIPDYIVIDSSGSFYITDGHLDCVWKFTSEGQFITKWGSEGTGDGEFQNPHGIAVDGSGNIYVADAENYRIQKFTSYGEFVTKWGVRGSGQGQFSLPWGIAVDKAGNVYVADSGNDRIQIFTPEGQFITEFGEVGWLPGQLNAPVDISIGDNGKIYIVERDNNRVQVFNPIFSEKKNKAIIVAGGGDYYGNNLWDATQMSANFAYRALTYQGFTKETIYYLTSDTDLDLDSNGEADDVDDDATNANLQQAITTWAADTNSLFIYLVDHGGNTTFRMSASETLSATDLDSWLDQLQQTVPGKVVVVYDACESGSFIANLSPPPGKDRLVITSTSPGEPAYFVNRGSVSFSNYFWTHIFNGVNLKDAFVLARDAIGQTTDFQHPLLDANGNCLGNEGEDYNLVRNLYIGNGTVIHGDAPVIGSVSEPQNISGTSSTILTALDVTDHDGIARVWAVIRPPDYNQGSSDNPIQELPSVDLLSIGGDQYERRYDGFNIEGTYHVAIYARDRIGNTSIPELTTVTVENPLRRKAIIVVGGTQTDPLWPALEKNATLAYEALSFQGYTDDDIYFLSPVTFSVGVEGLSTLSNLAYAIGTWARQSTLGLVLYVVGNGDGETFELNETEILSASDLDTWLDDLQDKISGKLTVIYDANRSGGLLPSLKPPDGKERILISSATGDQPAHFLSQGDISFSKFFWRRVLNGMNVRDSFIHAKNAMQYCRGQIPQLDDNGNGIGNEKRDGQLSRNYTLGVGIMLAGDDPIIGSVSPEQTLNGEASATIWARNVTTTGIIARLWAVITTPGNGQSIGGLPLTVLPVIDLIYNASSNRYEASYDGFPNYGTYEIAIYAMDTDGNVSLPIATKVYQAIGPDIYEDDDSPSLARVIVINNEKSQTHTFHDAGDRDWVKFYGLSGETYTIETSNLGSSCDAVIELYGMDGKTLLSSKDDGLTGEDEILDWLCPADGVYYVKVKHYDPFIFGENTDYDLQVYVPIAPLTGFIAGTITNAYSLEPIEGVRIKTGGKITALSFTDGNYLMVHPAGTYTITVEASGYGKFEDTVTVGEGGTITKNIAMVPSTGTVAVPTFSPVPGTYNSAQSVGISCGTPGATIRYTTDGSEPTEQSQPCTGKIDVSVTTTLKAKAFKADWSPSATATAAYTIILDSDNDGMPDDWEEQHGLNPLFDDSLDDADGDGFSNLMEYQRNTDPDDQESHPPRAMPWIPLLLGED